MIQLGDVLEGVYRLIDIETTNMIFVNDAARRSINLETISTSEQGLERLPAALCK